MLKNLCYLLSQTDKLHYILSGSPTHCKKCGSKFERFTEEIDYNSKTGNSQGVFIKYLCPKAAGLLDHAHHVGFGWIESLPQ